MKRRYGLMVVSLLLVFTLVAISPQSAQAGNYFVTTAPDLVTAITAANTAGGATTIFLADDISLTAVAESNVDYGDSGLPAITADITIEGQGHSISRIDALSTPDFRIFRVAPIGTLTLYNLTISGGEATMTAACPFGACGSGLYNEGILTLNNTTVTANTVAVGTGLYGDGGSVNITNSTFSNNSTQGYGAGIYMWEGSLNIVDSLFSGNTATSNGGGLYINHGSQTIDHTTFIGNTTTGKGGGIMSLSSQAITITNSTFSNNSAHEGAGIMLLGSAHVSNSTFSGNTGVGTNSVGGGANLSIYYGSIILDNLTFVGNAADLGGGIAYSGAQTLDINNTIIVQSGAGGNCIVDGQGIRTSGADDLADDAYCPNFTDLTNPPQNLNIGTLADNGGSTQTYALSSPSPALDSGSALCTGFDQRGIARGIDINGIVNSPQSGDCDIGAFEAGGTIRTLQFASPSSSVPIGATSTYHIPLTLDSTLVQADTVKGYVWVSGGTAVAGEDYAPFGVQTVSITPGNRMASAVITLLNPSSTTDKTIILSFATQHGPGFSGAVGLGTQLTHTATLKADAIPKRNYFTTNTPTLTWNRISQVSRYEIQVTKNSTFTGATLYDAGNQLSFKWPVALTNGTYNWHVRACKDVAETSCGAWSTPDTFTVFVP